MNVTRKANIWIVSVWMIFIHSHCSNLGAGFGSYEKPNKHANKYYRKDFKQTNTILLLGRRYQNTDTSLRKQDEQPNNSYFVFYANGFVLNNATIPGEKNELDYSKITYQCAGSYITIGDTIYWGAKAGYMKKVNYYSAIISKTGLQVLDKPEFEQARFFSLQ